MTSPPRSSKADPIANPGAAMADPTISQRYRLVETLAAGAEDAIFLCRRLDTGALVELRVLSGKLGADRLVAPAVRQQATVVARIASHGPGVAAVYECERAANGELVLVMEHPEGPTLRDVLQRDGTVSRRRALDLAIQIAQALELAHNFGLVHGGLRPENVILVDSEESVVLTHFGFDWLLQSRSASAGRGSAPRVQPSAYQAPEQAAGEVVEQSDVYALGAILYEMLAGAPPPADRASRRFDPEPLTKRRSDVTPDLGRIIMRALDVEPARRPADVSTMCNDLWVEAGPKSPMQPGRFNATANQRMGKRAKQLAALGGVAMLGAAAVWVGYPRLTSSTAPAPAARAAAPGPAPEATARAAAPGPAPEATAPAPAPSPESSSAPSANALDRPTNLPKSASPPSSGAAVPPIALPSAPPRRLPSPERPPSLRSTPKPPVTSPSPPAIATPPEPPEPRPVAQSGEPTQPKEPPAPVVDALPAAPPKSAAPPAAKTPSARRESAEDPGAIIDWLLGEGSAQRR